VTQTQTAQSHWVTRRNKVFWEEMNYLYCQNKDTARNADRFLIRGQDYPNPQKYLARYSTTTKAPKRTLVV
jgi:hypothetical protein